MKFFSFNKNQAAVLTTLVLLAMLGACYFFIYVPQNESRIIEQRFNALQNIDRNIHTKIENSIALLNNLLTNYQNADKDKKANLKKYIAGYSSANFTLTIPDTLSPFKRKLLKDSIDMDSTYTIMVNDNSREISLFFFKQEVNEARNGTRDTTVYKMGMMFTFKQFIHFLLPRNVFDDYIVFSEGKPVYESFPAGISYVEEDSLLGTKDGIGSSGVRNQVISGTEYKLFLQPVGFDANNEWVICGLVSNKHYQNEKSQLPTQIVLLLVTIMLIGLVAFPWLKLYHMGSKDRLTIFDGVASIFISMILLSLIFFVFFKYNYPCRPPKVNNDSKNNLANGIYRAFNSEIQTVYQKLVQFDSLNTLEKKENDIINLDKHSIAFAKGGKPGEDAQKKIGDIIHGININQVFWLNKNGDEIINWTADSINAPRGNYKNREYFKRISEHREYFINEVDTNRFFLEQVISWTSGTFRSVLSMESKLPGPDSPAVAALSFNLKSLDRVVLPTGYLFAITDNSGNVLYHSESSRNLNENLLNVFSKTSQLKGYLNAKAPGTFSTKYYGNEYNVEVKPVNGLPYFIIIFEDTVYHETREMEIYSFTFSMLFFFFGFLVLQLFTIFLVSAKRSFFKKQLYDSSWIGPKISSNNEYILSAVFNCIVIFLLILFFNYTTFLQYLFMLLFSVTFIPLFLNNIFAKRYAGEKRSALQFKSLAKYWLWGFIGIIAIIALNMLELRNFIYLLGYALLVILLGEWFYKNRRSVLHKVYLVKESKRSKILFGKWNYVNSFAAMTLTRLIITSGLPVVFFYVGAHSYEQNLSIRYRQHEFANRLVNRFPVTPADSFIIGNNKGNGVYYDGNLISDVTVVSRREALSDNNIKSYSKEDSFTLQLLKLFRVYLTDKAVRQDKFYIRGANDSSFFFNHLLRDAGEKETGTITYKESSLPGEYLKIQSENLNYQFPSVFKKNKLNGALFWLLLLLALFVFYFIICIVIKKLFSLNLPELEIWKGLDNKILINKEWDRPLFVIGVPGAGKLNYLMDKISNEEITSVDGTPLCYKNDEEKKNVFIAELINIPSTGNDEEEKVKWKEYIKKVFDEKNRMIIVNHFEYNIQDPVSNHFKLEFLERLYLETKCKIVILSTIHPVAFLDSAMDPSLKQQEKAVKPEEKSVPGQDLERWHVLLGHYRLVILPLQLRSGLSKTSMTGSILDKKSNKGLAGVDVMVMGTFVEAVTIPDGQFTLPDQSLPFRIIISLPGYNTKEVEIKKQERSF